MHKTVMIGARALPEEKEVLERLASLERRNQSETIRELIRAEAKRRGFWPPPQQEAYSQGV